MLYLLNKIREISFVKQPIDLINFLYLRIGRKRILQHEICKINLLQAYYSADLMKNPMKTILKKKKKDNSPDYRNRKKGIDGPNLFCSY